MSKRRRESPQAMVDRVRWYLMAYSAALVGIGFLLGRLWK